MDLKYAVYVGHTPAIHCSGGKSKSGPGSFLSSVPVVKQYRV